VRKGLFQHHSSSKQHYCMKLCTST